MAELGDRLRAAREQKELSLEQVAAETRIPIAHLAALETESFDVFSSGLHARGFLRTYASYLGLDPEEISGLHDQTRGRHTEGGMLVSVPGSPPAGRGRMIAVDVLLGLVLVAILGTAALAFFWTRAPQDEAPPTEGPPATASVTPMPVFEGTEYTLEVGLDYDQHKLDVRERIDYTNVTSDTLPNLTLNVHPNCSRGTFKLEEIRVDLDGELVQPEVFALDVWLRVELPRELRPGEHVTALLDFTLNLPKTGPDTGFNTGGLGYSARAVSLGNWYPVLAPYREDKGWYNLSCFPIGDPYVTDVADYHVTITSAQDLIIAATGQETRTDEGWHFEAEEARSFAFAASDRYQVSTSQLGEVTVHSYYFPTNEEAGQAALDTAANALALFTELYGPYPYRDYRVAETEFSGGLEFTGMTFLGSTFYDEYDGTTQTPLIDLAAHEVAHQWFYGLVGNDQVTEPWLDEALAQYSAYLYYERNLPGDTDWWWYYAVDQWAPTGIIDARIHEFDSERDYLDAVYRRGAQFIRDLRETMSDPAFFAFLREYQRRYAYRLVQSRDFFELVREFTTADLVPLEEDYFRQRILP